MRLSRTLVFLIVTLMAAHAGLSQSTAFSYQGRLTDGGSAAGGMYDMEFALFDALADGSQVGSTQSIPNVQVTNGTFAVELDFGAQFPGQARFLEIRISPHGQSSFTTLQPRQRILSIPYAVKSLSAETANNSLQLGGVAASQYVQTNDARLSDARAPIAGSPNYIQNTVTQQSGANFNIDGDGTVGGTLTANDVRLGSSGEYRAASGQESLRIIRGNIGGGSIPQILAGTGFTIGPLVPFDDKITILYDTPFTTAPSVVVTPQSSSGVFSTLRDPTSTVPATHGFIVTFYLHTGTLTPTTPFNFIVVGPR
jgi:hypothetical protein